MNINTVIFDLDGLLIDSEPFWNEAAATVFKQFGKVIDEKQFSLTTGLRTKEFVDWWFDYFKIDKKFQQKAGDDIVENVIDKIITRGKIQPGVEYILHFFSERNFKIGLASSSPEFFINTAIDHFALGKYFKAITSASELSFGKPHPQVYLDCAQRLSVPPTSCLCFEDSFNGLIAAKAARMKCVVVPAYEDRDNKRWHAADLKISSLANFNELLLQTLPVN